MATKIDFGRASALPLSVVLSAIPSFPRAVIERLTTAMIDRLDELDGDSDFEPDDFDAAVDDSPCDEDFDREDDHALDDRECTDPSARAAQRQRIRRTRCMAVRERNWRTGRRDGPVVGWQSWDEPTVPTRRQIMRRKRGLPKRPRG